MKKGDRVQVWDEEKHICLGWGTIVVLAISVKGLGSLIEPEPIPLIQLESGKKIWGDKCNWITEKRVAEVGVRLFRDIYKRSR